MVKEHGKGVHDVALVDLLMKKGRYQWSVVVKSIDSPEDFLIGVAAPGIPLEANPLESGMFWGFQPFQ